MVKAGYSQLSYYQKLHLKEMLENGVPKVKMAEKLHVGRTTIFNEIKRGTINGVYDPEYSEEKRYSTVKVKPMVSSDERLAEYIAKLILEKHMSPEAIVKHLKEETHEFEKYPSSPVTIYSAIDDGLIPNVTREDLNSNKNPDVMTVYSDGIHFPAKVKTKLGIKNGDRYRFICRKNGDIILKKFEG